jgi:hypothetical protein
VQLPIEVRRGTREVAVTTQRRRASHPVGRSLWNTGDAALLAVLSAAGGGGLAVCWWGISDEANWHLQLSWVAGAFLSLAVAGLGVCLWLYRGRLRVRRASAAVWSDLRNRHADWDDLFEHWRAARTGGTGGTGAASSVTQGWVSSPTMTRYHDASCALVRGKTDVSSVTADDIAHRGLRECGACAE